MRLFDTIRGYVFPKPPDVSDIPVPWVSVQQSTAGQWSLRARGNGWDDTFVRGSSPYDANGKAKPRGVTSAGAGQNIPPILTSTRLPVEAEDRP